MHALWGQGRSISIPSEIKQKYPPEIILGSEETGSNRDSTHSAKNYVFNMLGSSHLKDETFLITHDELRCIDFFRGKFG